MRSNEILTNARYQELEEQLRLTENRYLRSQEVNRQLIIENSRLSQEKDFAFKRIAGLEQQLLLQEKKNKDEKDILQYQMAQIRLQQEQPQQPQPRLTYVPGSNNNSNRSSLNSKQSNNQVKQQLTSFENVEEEQEIGVFNTQQLQASGCTFASRNPFILGNNNNKANKLQQQQQSKRIEQSQQQYDVRPSLNSDQKKKENKYAENSPFSPKMAITSQRNDSFVAVSPVSSGSGVILEFVDDEEEQEQIQNDQKTLINTLQIRSTSNRQSENNSQGQQQHQRKEQKQIINNLPSYERSYSNSGAKFQSSNQQIGQVPEFNAVNNRFNSFNSNTTADTTNSQSQGNNLVSQQSSQGGYQQMWLQHKQKSENEVKSSPFRLSEQIGEESEQQSRIFGIGSSYEKKQRKIFQIAPAKPIQRKLTPVSPIQLEEIEQKNRIIEKCSDQQDNKKISMFEVKPVILNNNLTFQKASHNSLSEQYVLQYQPIPDSFGVDQHYLPSEPENKYSDRPEQKFQTNFQVNPTKPKQQPQQMKKAEIQFISENSLIENFYIFSADQRQLQDSATFHSQSEQILKPETIYSLFPNKLIDGNKIEEDLMRLSFPRGVEAKKKVQSDSMNELIKIISLEKLSDIGQDGFVFVVKTQKSYEKKNNSEDNLSKKQKDIVDELNPNHLLYCICVCQRNFVLEKKKQAGSNEKDKKKKKQIEYFFDFQMVYCIVTKLPHVQYFIKVLESITNLFKFEKMNNYYTYDDPSQIDLFFFQVKKIKNSIIFIIFTNQQINFSQKIENLLETKLTNLASSKVPLPGCSFISQQLPNEVKQVNLEIEDLAKSCYMETYWGIASCFSRFQKSSDIIAIYAELLLEHSTIFVSESKTILSQYILLFHAMLQPLKWPHPIIFTLPTSFTDLLDSPSPIIVGINDNKDSLQRHNFEETYSSHNIIYLDDMSFHMAERLSMDDSDYLTEILNRTEKQFQNFMQRMFAENTPDVEDIDMRNLGIEILQSFKDIFINRIVSCLPVKPKNKQGLLVERHILDVDAILQEILQCNSTKGHEDHFITTIFKTQGFILFLEEFYGIS